VRAPNVGLPPTDGSCSSSVESSTLRGDGLPDDFSLREPQRVLNSSKHIQVATEVLVVVFVPSVAEASHHDRKTHSLPSHSRNERDRLSRTSTAGWATSSSIILQDGPPHTRPDRGFLD
jgi:hypothetical protein